MGSRFQLNRAGVALVFLWCCELSLLGQNDKWQDLTNQVLTLSSNGNLAQAEPIAKQAVDIARKTFGKTHSNYAVSLNNLGQVYSTLGQYSDAKRAFDESVSVYVKNGSADIARPLGNLSMMYVAQGKYVEAEETGVKAVDITTKTYGQDSINTTAAQSMLAQIYMAGGKPLQAMELYKLVIQVDEKILPSDNVELGRAYGNLGYLYQMTGRRSDAKETYGTALRIFQVTLTANDPLIVKTRQYLWQLGDEQQGIPPSKDMVYQQCMAERINSCMADCMNNYHYKQSKCSNEMCSITNPKTISNRDEWTTHCRRKAERSNSN